VYQQLSRFAERLALAPLYLYNRAELVIRGLVSLDENALEGTVWVSVRGPIVGPLRGIRLHRRHIGLLLRTHRRTRPVRDPRTCRPSSHRDQIFVQDCMFKYSCSFLVVKRRPFIGSLSCHNFMKNTVPAQSRGRLRFDPVGLSAWPHHAGLGQDSCGRRACRCRAARASRIGWRLSALPSTCATRPPWQLDSSAGRVASLLGAVACPS